jgi:hypothetical protein
VTPSTKNYIFLRILKSVCTNQDICCHTGYIVNRSSIFFLKQENFHFNKASRHFLGIIQPPASFNYCRSVTPILHTNCNFHPVEFQTYLSNWDRKQHQIINTFSQKLMLAMSQQCPNFSLRKGLSQLRT